ncbi:hypothetical protein UlMin_008356 [Ulmus minor]
MGYIYGAINSAKELIANNLGGEESTYKEIWKIIDDKWDFQLHQDLHVVAYYLNPRFKLTSTTLDFNLIDGHIDSYRHKLGMFGMRAAVNSYKTRTPNETKELKSLAIRILGLTCSSSACERNWSTFNQVHTKRSNRLTTTKLNRFVYIMYNKKLKLRYMKIRLTTKDEEDPLIDENLFSDDEWIGNPNDEEIIEERDQEINLIVDEMSNDMRDSHIDLNSKTCSKFLVSTIMCAYLLCYYFFFMNQYFYLMLLNFWCGLYFIYLRLTPQSP